MGVTFDHRDPGTPEAEWADAAPWRSHPELDLAADELVVLAAHPDDETLGAGGLLAEAHRRGIRTTVVVVTDGDAAPADDGGGRRAESARALDVLAPGARLVFLGYPDGGTREHAAEIERDVRMLLPDDPLRTALIACPWWGDGHRDHRIVGEIALRLAAPHRRVVGYQVWLWHWGDPAAVSTEGWRVLPVPGAVRARKDRAIGCHTSQLLPGPDGAPILHAGMRAHFARDVEVFVAPAADAHPTAGVGPAYFDDLFRRHDDPWGFADRWYEERKRAVLLAALPDRRHRSALEIGCATGEIARAVADRSDRVTAIDGSAWALERARALGDADGRVAFIHARVPREWPDGRFDLVIVSEVLYYLDAADRAATIARIRAGLRPGDVVVACHWRPPIDGAPATGDDVHRELRAGLGAPLLATHVEDDFVLDVYRAGASRSVAAAEGLR